LKKVIEIYCCGCQENILARLTNGEEIYPSRNDLSQIPFWICDKCQNHVGCHHKGYQPTKPLGCIPTPELRKARRYIHQLIDPLWKTGGWKRKDVYQSLANLLDLPQYHTGNIRTIEEARNVYRAGLILVQTHSHRIDKHES
jgi:hypothetical protein